MLDLLHLVVFYLLLIRQLIKSGNGRLEEKLFISEEEIKMNNNTKNYLITIALFSLMLFAILSIIFGSQDIVRDSLLSILTVSYIVNNLPLNKE